MKATHMKVWHGMTGPVPYCGTFSDIFAADGVHATCKRCWARHERVMRLVRAERVVREHNRDIARDK